MDHQKKWDLAKENRQIWNTRTNDNLAREILDNPDHILEIPKHVFRSVLSEASERVNAEEDYEFNTQAQDTL